MPPDADASPAGSDDPDPVRVVSPDRPIPLSVQMELQEYGLIRTERPDQGPAEVAYVRRRPPAELVEANDLSLAGAHRELWRGPDDRLVEIRPDAVLIDGTETDIDPTEAREHVRATDHEPVEVPDGSGGI